MSKRLIPNADLDFKTKVWSFAHNITKDPQRFNLTPADAQEMTTAVERFAEALQKARFSGGRSRADTLSKDQARAECERLYRRCIRKIKLSDSLDASTLFIVGLRPPEGKRRARTCPQEPPRLRFLRAIHEGAGSTPVHELEFRAFDYSGARPAGAVRMELFVDLIPPDEAIPSRPGANHSSRPWYLRSYTRSPFRLIPPMARVPMRVVYWGRWADSVGNVGPFSATAAAWIEGGSHHGLPGAPAMFLEERKQVPILEDARAPGPASRERTYVVAVLEAQYESLAPQRVARELPAGGENAPQLPTALEREVRQLEDQTASEAA